MVSTTPTLPEDPDLTAEAVHAWLEELGRPYDQEGRDRLRAAADRAFNELADTHLETAESRLRHNLATAEILAELRLDADTLSAAILNGLPVDAAFEAAFGAAVARMVAGLDRLAQLAALDTADDARSAENLRRLLLGMTEDVRAILVALAERLHLLRRARGLSDEIRRRLGRETRDIYGPLANRLGVWQLKWELEDLSLRFLDPGTYRRIATLLEDRRSERQQGITEVMETLREAFAEAGIPAELSGRPKHIYSIWRKMQRKGVDFEQIFDVRAVRVLVSDLGQCYGALGVVHGLWRHIPGEFDDYIATPKANGYQSIHTAVIGPDGKPLEVQIRTRAMHRDAELGIAAHWRYKENAGHDSELERRILWMRNWLDLQDEGGSPEAFLERFKDEFQPVRIYVLTPRNQVIELPRGATPLDFAYAIHSDVGHRCRGARVDGRIAPLTQPLESGQRVEILTAREPAPSRDWLNPQLGYLKTARARSRVRQWFKQHDYLTHLEQGKALLERELTPLRLASPPDLEALAQHFNLVSGDDLLAALGRGEIRPAQVLKRVVPPTPPHRRIQARPKTPPGGVLVEGIGDVLTHIAHCCKPVPPDPIRGFITRGHGVSIHHHDCPNIRRLAEAHPERVVEVAWSGDGQSRFPLDLAIHASDRKGLLRDISAQFAEDEIDVIGVNTRSDRGKGTARMRFTVEIEDLSGLQRVIRRLQAMPEVLEVRRARPR